MKHKKVFTWRKDAKGKHLFGLFIRLNEKIVKYGII